MNFDPTKKYPPVQFVTRPDAQIGIKWNPNNGNISIGSDGLSPMEEIGVLYAALKLRSDIILKPTDPARIEIAAGVPKPS